MARCEARMPYGERPSAANEGIAALPVNLLSLCQEILWAESAALNHPSPALGLRRRGAGRHERDAGRWL